MISWLLQLILILIIIIIIIIKIIKDNNNNNNNNNNNGKIYTAPFLGNILHRLRIIHRAFF